MRDLNPPPTTRGLVSVLLAFGVFMASCSGGQDPRAVAEATTSTTAVVTTATIVQATTTLPPTTQSSTTSTTSTTQPPTTQPPASLPEVPAYELPTSEVEREQKQLAGQFVQAIITYQAGTDAATHAGQLASVFSLEPTPELDALVAEVVDPAVTSVGTIIYPQMGGLRPDAASVMVQARQETHGPDGVVQAESRVFDVRLVNVEGAWSIRELASNGGPRVERPADLSPEAVRVLDHPNLDLADSSRWDIYRGHTTPEMLTRMAEVADMAPISVLVLSSGHPFNVFATEKVSRHSAGNAMDVYAVDGLLVVDSRYEGSPAWTLAKQLFDNETKSIGSPWAFDGFGGRSFTDKVHQDHLHIISQ